VRAEIFIGKFLMKKDSIVRAEMCSRRDVHPDKEATVSSTWIDVARTTNFSAVSGAPHGQLIYRYHFQPC